MKTSFELVARAVFAVLFLTTTALVFSNLTQGADADLALSIYNASPSPAFTGFMTLLSQYGRELFWVLVIGAMFVLGSRETKLLALELGLLFLVGIIVGDVLKAFLFRSRPFETGIGIIARIPVDTDSSYPSGHALIVSIGAVFSLTKFRIKWLSALLTLEASLVCYSRVYLGVHYPLDVLAGVFAGSSIVLAGVFLIERYAGRWARFLGYVLEKVLGNGPLKL